MKLAKANKRERASRVLGYFKPYWRQWGVVFLCTIATAGLGVIPPLCVRAILDQAIPERNSPLLALLAGAYVILNAAIGVLGVSRTYFSTRAGQRVTADLRLELFRRLQSMSVPFFSSTRPGEIISRINNDVNAVQGTVTSTFVNIVGNVVAVVVTVAVIIAIDWRVAASTLVLLPLFLLPMYYVGGLRQRLSRLSQEKQAELTIFLQERLHIGGMLLSKTFGQGPSDAEKFQTLSDEYAELNAKQALAGQWMFLGISAGAAAIPALIYWYGGILAIHEGLTIGTIVAFVTYLTSLYGPIMGLTSVYIDLRGSIAVFDRIFEFLDLQPEIVDKPSAVRVEKAEGHVRFENVSFAYPASATSKGDDAKSERAAPFQLREVSFELLPGERVALVGPSGAGKTTITYLLPRFLDPESGRITLDGQDLRDLSQESLRAQIGVVTQETYLLHATVRENLLYARPDASYEAMVTAARAAHIHELIESLPQGYDTVVGERAFRLSGGERQRVSIARALLKDPRILILDEATSSLDSASEALVQQAMDTLLLGRTSLIVAHRLSTISGADKILVLDKGKLIEVGRHTDLMARDGLYSTLYNGSLG